MKGFQKIALIHFGLLLAYSIYCKSMGDDGFLQMIFLLFLHVVGLGIAALVSFVDRKKPQGGHYLLISFLILLVGFGTCSMMFLYKA